jgi:hypothetical protein
MDIEELNDNLIKFNTCKFRSNEKYSQTIQRCSCQGGNYTIEGFFCTERDIFDVKPKMCRDCSVYESK